MKGKVLTAVNCKLAGGSALTLMLCRYCLQAGLWYKEHILKYITYIEKFAFNEILIFN